MSPRPRLRGPKSLSTHLRPLNTSSLLLSGILLVVSLLPAATAWTLEGCYTFFPEKPLPQIAQTAAPPNTTVSTVADCVTKCYPTTSTTPFTSFALIEGKICRCVSESSFKADFYAVNVVECLDKCSDGLPCGNINARRFSAYKFNQTDEATIGTSTPSTASPTSSSTSSPSSSISRSGTATATPPVGTPNIIELPGRTPDNDTFSSGAGMSTQTRAWIIVGSLVGAVILLALGAVIYNRVKRKKEPVHTLPRLSSSSAAVSAAAGAASGTGGTESSSLFLIPGVLPRTPNMIYSVIRPFNPSATPSTSTSTDEIKLQRDEVVNIREVFSDGWAVGTNVSTGESGIFPLGCLVSDQGWATKSGFVNGPPTRSDSLTHNTSPEHVVDVKPTTPTSSAPAQATKGGEPATPPRATSVSDVNTDPPTPATLPMNSQQSTPERHHEHEHERRPSTTSSQGTLMTPGTPDDGGGIHSLMVRRLPVEGDFSGS
ncbi:hypothetical protein HK102_006648 [Quaeritorhiza haematococci]|nr:hypothetical protein HK102_006648 [Quaeritorhiza haematococci]